MALLTVRNVVNFVRILRLQFSFSGLVAAAAIGFVAAVLLCGFWLAFPERDVAELFAAVKAKAGAAASTIGDATIAEAEVDGYCDLFKQVLLMMITFGIWFFIWIYRMTRYLNRVGGEDKRTPVKQLLLCLFVPLVAGIVPHILMQGKINEIITFENSVVVAPVEEIAEECEEN